MYRWEGINEFVAVAETESFTRAAKRLDVSTAQVSRQVSALEARLSTRLFYRTTRRVSVTEAGQIFYQHCRQVLDALEQAERSITNMQLVPRGRLRLASRSMASAQIQSVLLFDTTVPAQLGGHLCQF